MSEGIELVKFETGDGGYGLWCEGHVDLEEFKIEMISTLDADDPLLDEEPFHTWAVDGGIEDEDSEEFGMQVICSKETPGAKPMTWVQYD